MVRRFAELATEAGAGHLLLIVSASSNEEDHIRSFFARHNFVPVPTGTSPNRLCLPPVP